MATISQLFGIGQSALGAHQARLFNSTNNLVNFDTAGYTRRIVTLSPQQSDGISVLASNPAAVRNPLLFSNLARSIGDFSFHQGQLSGLLLAQPALNDLDGSGLGINLSSLAGALSAATANPAGEIERQSVVDEGQAVAAEFGATRQQIRDAMDSGYGEALAGVEQASAYAKQVADLNGAIAASGNQAGVEDLVAQRDAAISELAELVGVQVLPAESGMVRIYTGGGRALVDGTDAAELTLTRGGQPDHTMSLTLTRSNGQEVAPLTSVSGRVGGLIAGHNDTLVSSLRELDQLAFDFVSTFNEQHGNGFTVSGGEPPSFFVGLGDDPAGAAAHVQVSPDIVSDVDLIAGAGELGEVPGGGSNFAALATLFTEASGYQDRFDSLVQSFNGDISAAQIGSATEQASIDQISSILSSQTGVSVDEELINISQTMTAIDAASQVITTANTLTQTLLDMVG